MEQGAGKIKSIVPGKAVATEMINACGERNAATRTAGGSNESQIGKAVWAEKWRPGRFQPPLTAQTQGGKQQIL
jgi:hypothetical protein